jgi:hypothetical protein
VDGCKLFVAVLTLQFAESSALGALALDGKARDLGDLPHGTALPVQVERDQPMAGLAEGEQVLKRFTAKCSNVVVGMVNEGCSLIARTAQARIPAGARPAAQEPCHADVSLVVETRPS